MRRRILERGHYGFGGAASLPPPHVGGYDVGGYQSCGLDMGSGGSHTAHMTPPDKGNLPRLEKHFYQGHAVVFWTNTLEERARGWLTKDFHYTFRELMLHAAAREELFCPAYCLMPDHLHLIWMGMRRETDQLNAMKFLRTQLEPGLGGGREWQHQPHDHVLREKERLRNAFASFCFYTLANPVRAELVKSEKDWPYNGAIVPGYPTLHPFQEGYWELFWKLYLARRNTEPPPPQTPSLREPT